ncbi:MAG: HTH-type transcriptional regulator LutR [Syntrophorhabdus sp. PtaU1.Bin058]|nr:MAG: HTH-type transcriptional regulator LutR [Syntrophorhabdus sp. PtaU1.Bin058]
MFSNIKEKRIFEKIVDEIKSAIETDKLRPGDKLPPEMELAKIFGVSRVTVREALRILELSGLILIKQGTKGGAFIKKMDAPQKLKECLSDYLKVGNITIDQLAEARYWIESIVMDIVCQKARKKDFELLSKSVKKAEQFYREGRERDRIDENWNFHILLVKITGNKILIETVISIIEMMRYMMLKITTDRKITENAFKAHKEIVDLLESGNLEKAKAVNRTHIEDLNDRLTKKYLRSKKT